MAGDGLGTGPEGAAPDELVLRDICENSVEGRVSAEDADRAIAKALQDQERAFMLLNTYGGENGYQDQTSDEDDDDDDEEGWVEDDGRGEEVDRDSSGEGEEEEDEEEDDDAALARRLQDAEDREHYRRLLELHGADGILEEYNEDEEDGYISDDSVDPDNMTYEELQALGEAVGNVSRGVSQDIIDALPNAKYTSRFSDEKPSDVSEEEEQCAVCRMEFEAGEDVRLLPCSHVYHPDCIGQWLHINKACPICSQEVTNPACKSERKVGTVLEPRNK